MMVLHTYGPTLSIPVSMVFATRVNSVPLGLNCVEIFTSTSDAANLQLSGDVVTDVSVMVAFEVVPPKLYVPGTLIASPLIVVARVAETSAPRKPVANHLTLAVIGVVHVSEMSTVPVVVNPSAVTMHDVWVMLKFATMLNAPVVATVFP